MSKSTLTLRDTVTNIQIVIWMVVCWVVSVLFYSFCIYCLVNLAGKNYGLYITLSQSIAIKLLIETVRGRNLGVKVKGRSSAIQMLLPREEGD